MDAYESGSQELVRLVCMVVLNQQLRNSTRFENGAIMMLAQSLIQNITKKRCWLYGFHGAGILMSDDR